MWEKVVEKTVNVEIKASLQLFSGTREINFKYPKGYRPLSKKNKFEANWEHWDKDKDKAKPHNLYPPNTNQLQTQASKKCHGSHQGDHLATGVHTTKIAKKNKDKAKN